MRLAWIGGGVLVVLAVAVLLLLRSLGPAAPPPCRSVMFETDLFTVCEADLRQAELRLVSDDASGGALRSFLGLERYLGRDARRVRFAMNAGMFNDDGRAIGLYVEHGEERQPINTRRGPGNFHMLPNGVFSVDIDGVARVETTSAFLERRGTPVWATQSGPMLVIDGRLHPRFQNDGPSRIIRNGVGACDGARLLFAISETPVSFGKFARFFRDELNCPNALFLDGTVSSLWAPDLDRRDTGYPLGPMVVLLAPEPS